MGGDDERAAESDSRPDEPTSEAVASAYDRFASSYAAEIPSNPYNVDMDFPGTTALVPEIGGDRILEAGCGTGLYTGWLLQAGADVVAVDASREMLAEASDRLPPGPERPHHSQAGDVPDPAELDQDGDDAYEAEDADEVDNSDDADDAEGPHQASRGTVSFCRGDLARPLPFADDAFDGIVSGLVLNYVEDWGPLFAEFARVLRPGGFVVFSVGHPADEFPLDDEESYFETRQKTKEWAVEIPYFARPLSAMVNPVLGAGFRLAELAEPEPTEGFREKRPERYEKESRHPVFVAFRFVLPAD